MLHTLKHLVLPLILATPLTSCQISGFGFSGGCIQKAEVIIPGGHHIKARFSTCAGPEAKRKMDIISAEKGSDKGGLCLLNKRILIANFQPALGIQAETRTCMLQGNFLGIIVMMIYKPHALIFKWRMELTDCLLLDSQERHAPMDPSCWEAGKAPGWFTCPPSSQGVQQACLSPLQRLVVPGQEDLCH